MKIPGEYAGDVGGTLVLVILLLLFLGGTILLVRSAVHFMHSLEASKRQKDTQQLGKSCIADDTF